MDKFKWFMDKYELELSSSEKSAKKTDAGAQEGECQAQARRGQVSAREGARGRARLDPAGQARHGRRGRGLCHAARLLATRQWHVALAAHDLPYHGLVEDLNI